MLARASVRQKHHERVAFETAQKKAGREGAVGRLCGSRFSFWGARSRSQRAAVAEADKSPPAPSLPEQSLFPKVEKLMASFNRDLSDASCSV